MVFLVFAKVSASLADVAATDITVPSVKVTLYAYNPRVYNSWADNPFSDILVAKA
jgi:hypothetical protein